MGVDRSRLPEVGADPPFSFPAFARHKLANGLEVRIVEHRSMPVLAVALIVDGGSGADPAGREGLTAIVADMVDEGTGGLTAIDVSDAIARIGGSYNVDVGPDATMFSLVTLTRFARRGLSLLSDMVTKPSLLGADFDRLRKLRLDRLRQLEDSPPAVAERAFLELLYAQHPYGHLSIGHEETLAKLTLADVVSFHDLAFRPSSATVIVAGAMDHEELLQAVEGAFGGWQDRGPRNPAQSGTAAIIEPDKLSGGIAIVTREGAAQSELRMGHLSARRDTPDYHALLVMNAVLGGQFVSRINLKLREEKGYTYGARTGFDWRRGLGPFSLQASVHTAATADAIRDALNELEAIRSWRPVSGAELSLAKASITRGYPRSFETAQQVARSVAQLALYGLPDNYLVEFVPTVHAVDEADVTRVARQYLDPSQLTTLVVGDYPVIGEPLRALGLGEPRVL